MIVRPYEKGDEANIKAREQVADFDCNFAWTVEIDSIPVAIWGLNEFTISTAHIWAIVSDDVRGKGIEFTKKAKKMFDLVFNTYSYKRVQTFIAGNVEENARWVELFGLEYEATMKSAMPDGSDMKIYARIL